MSFQIQQIKKRLATTRQVQKVTKAMQQVASARLSGDRRTIQSSGTYTERLTEVLLDVVAELDHASHPLLTMPPDGRPAALVVFGSDRGLCGGFNLGLIEQTLKFIAARPGHEVQVITIGKRADRRLRREQLNVVHHEPQPSRENRAATIDALATLVQDMFATHVVDEVHVVYKKFHGVLNQEAVVERLLPLPLALSKTKTFNAGGFEPRPEEILETLLPEFIRQSLDHAFLNSMASENASRQAAMTRASENAGEMIEELTASYRQLRQENITSEMLELIGGGSMLKQKEKVHGR